MEVDDEIIVFLLGAAAAASKGARRRAGGRDASACCWALVVFCEYLDVYERAMNRPNDLAVQDTSKQASASWPLRPTQAQGLTDGAAQLDKLSHSRFQVKRSVILICAGL